MIPMVRPFDIFRVEIGGHLVWRETAKTSKLATWRI